MSAALKQLVMGQKRADEWRKYEMSGASMLHSDGHLHGVCVGTIPHYSDIVEALEIIHPSGSLITSVEVYSGGLRLMKTLCDNAVEYKGSVTTSVPCGNNSVEYKGSMTTRVPFGEFPYMNLPYSPLEVHVEFDNMVTGKVYMNACHIFIKNRVLSESGSFKMRSNRVMITEASMNQDDYAELYLLGFRYQDRVPESVKIVDTKYGWDVLSYDEQFILAHSTGGELLLRNPLKVTSDYKLVTDCPIVCLFERTISYETNATTHETKLT